MIYCKKLLFCSITILLVIVGTNMMGVAKEPNKTHDIFLQIKGNANACGSIENYLNEKISDLPSHNVTNEITNSTHIIILKVSRNFEFKPTNLFNVGLVAAPISYYKANRKKSCLINNLSIISDFDVISESNLSEKCWKLLKSNKSGW